MGLVFVGLKIFLAKFFQILDIIYLYFGDFNLIFDYFRLI